MNKRLIVFLQSGLVGPQHKRIRFPVLFLLLCFVIPLRGYSQTSVLPPTAEQVERFIDHPVALNTGVAQIDIPLFSIPFGGSSIPVSLKYHASGIKYGQNSGRVGLGWTLDLNYMISWTVRGLQDEFFDKVNLDSVNFNGFSSPYERDKYLSKFVYSHAVNMPLDFYTSQRYDGEHDIYRYSLPDRSGRFFITGYGANPETVMVDDYNRALVIEGNPISNNNFKARDDKGWQYHFGPGALQYSNQNTMVWNAQKITALNGDSMVFSYDTIAVDQTGVLHKSAYVREGCKSCLPFNMNVSTNFSLNPPPYNYVDKELAPSKVVFPGGYLLIIYNNNSSIYKIGMFTSNHQFIRSVEFEYANEGGHTFLKRVGIMGGEGRLLDHKLDYHTDYMGTAYKDMALDADYWGYYKANNLSSYSGIGYPALVSSFGIYNPAISGNQSIESLSGGQMPFLDRGTFGNFHPIYLLKSIRYQDERITEYKYEMNVVQATQLVTGAGARIREIVSRDLLNSDSTVRKVYLYGNGKEVVTNTPGDWGEGYVRNNDLVNSSRFIMQDALIGVRPNEAGQALNWMLYNTYTFSNHYAADMSYSNLEGNPVYYDRVREITYDSKGTLGMVEYRYDRPADLFFIPSGAPLNSKPNVTNQGLQFRRFFPVNYRSVSLGDRPQLVNKVVYKLVGGSWQAQKKDTYEYSYRGNGWSNGSLKNLKVRQYARLSGEPMGGLSYASIYAQTNIESFFDFSVYDIQLSRRLLWSHRTVLYEVPGDSVEQRVTYDRYYSHDYVVRKDHYGMDGRQETLWYTYPQDYAVGTPFIDSLVQSRSLSSPIEHLRIVDGKVVSGSLTEYLPRKGGLAKKVSHLNLVEGILEGSFNLSNKTGTFNPDGRYRPLMHFDRYDAKGRLLELHGEQAPKSSQLWGYGGLYVVAQVQNAGIDEIAYSSFETAERGNWTYSGSRVADASAPTGDTCYVLTGSPISRSGLSAGKEYRLSYWKKGSASVTLSGGTVLKTTTGRSIDGWTYVTHAVKGVTTLTVSGSGTIDELRLHPKGAVMTTRTYRPLVGVSSEADSRGRVVYYEYDGFQRLKTIRDQDRNIIQNINRNKL